MTNRSVTSAPPLYFPRAKLTLHHSLIKSGTTPIDNSRNSAMGVKNKTKTEKIYSAYGFFFRTFELWLKLLLTDCELSPVRPVTSATSLLINRKFRCRVREDREVKT